MAVKKDQKQTLSKNAKTKNVAKVKKSKVIASGKKTNRKPMIALICVQSVALFVFVVIAIVSGAWFRDAQTIMDTITVGSIDVEWVNAEGASYSDPRDFVISENAVVSGSEFTKEMFIKNTGTNGAYLRARVMVYVNTAEEGQDAVWEESGLWVSPYDIDQLLWYQTSDGYYYYRGVDTATGGENALVGCIYQDTFIEFASVFKFVAPLPDSLLNKMIKVEFRCETIQDRNDAVLSAWLSAPSEWLSEIGETPEVYIRPTSSANNGAQTYDITADPQQTITLQLDNIGTKACFIKIDIEFNLSNNDLPGASILSFTAGEDLTFCASDGKYYYEYQMANGEENREFVFTPVVNSELDLTGVTYNVVFHIESLVYDESVTLEHEFFEGVEAGFVLPGVRSGE